MLIENAHQARPPRLWTLSFFRECSAVKFLSVQIHAPAWTSPRRDSAAGLYARSATGSCRVIRSTLSTARRPALQLLLPVPGRNPPANAKRAALALSPHHPRTRAGLQPSPDGLAIEGLRRACQMLFFVNRSLHAADADREWLRASEKRRVGRCTSISVATRVLRRRIDGYAPVSLQNLRTASSRPARLPPAQKTRPRPARGTRFTAQVMRDEKGPRRRGGKSLQTALSGAGAHDAESGA